MERAPRRHHADRSAAVGSAADRSDSGRPSAGPVSPGRPRFAVVAPAVVAAAILTACLSSDAGQDTPQVLSPREAAEELIAGPIATEIGLGELTASCPEMNQATAGDVFPCTAATETQRTISIDAAILPSGQVELTTTNLIGVDAIASFEQAAIDALNERLEVTLAPDAIDCGESAVVLADDRMMICALTDPTTDQIFDVSITVEDIETRQFSLVVANQPRG